MDDDCCILPVVIDNLSVYNCWYSYTHCIFPSVQPSILMINFPVDCSIFWVNLGRTSQCGALRKWPAALTHAAGYARIAWEWYSKSFNAGFVGNISANYGFAMICPSSSYKVLFSRIFSRQFWDNTWDYWWLLVVLRQGSKGCSWPTKMSPWKCQAAKWSKKVKANEWYRYPLVI